MRVMGFLFAVGLALTAAGTATAETGQDKYAAAKATFEADPASADALIWYGRRAGYLGRYDEAVRIFTDGVARHPTDARMLRHRGHRYISLGELDKAIADLTTASRLIAGTANRIEPDGLPNARGIPVSTLHDNIWYHLGLAHYLAADFEPALAAFTEGLHANDNVDTLVSTGHWRYMILRRLGRPDEATRVLAAISPDLDVVENQVYHRLCLFYKGLLSEAALLATEDDGPGDSALMYGLANWYFYEGRRAEAKARLETIVKTNDTYAFGTLAAKADLGHWQD